MLFWFGPKLKFVLSAGEPIRVRRRTTAMSAAAITVLPLAARRALKAPRTGKAGAPGYTVELAHLSDEALVALAGRADKGALAELYDRHGRVAYGMALRIVRDESLAEDAVQDGFMAVWKEAARYVPARGKASSWIFTLIHRRAVDIVRREERRRTDVLEPADAPSDEQTDELAWLRLQRERVQDALRQLPDQQREALELAYYGGFTQAELADRLGQPLGTIKSRMFAGLSRLRELLEEPSEETAWTRS